MSCVLIVPVAMYEESMDDARRLAGWLDGQGVDVVWAPTILPDEGFEPQGVDLVVALGGDGTLLRAARLASGADQPVPILGLSYGHLGFLTCARDGQTVEQLVGQALAGELRPSRRQTLDVRITGIDSQGAEQERRAFALNEVVLSRGGSGKIVEFGVSVNSRHVTDLRGDGFVIATATGSTGYALSAGGPVVAPETRGMVCVPIAPHTLTARAFLSAPADVVEVTVTDGRSLDRCVFVDGDNAAEGLVPVSMTVRRGDNDVILLRKDADDFYESVSRVFYGNVR